MSARIGKLSTDINPLGEWYAYDMNRYDGAPDAGRQSVGYGRTEAEAIADLQEQLDEEEEARA